MHAWLHIALQWLNAHPHYVIAVTGVVTFLESVLVLGSIVPGSVFVLAIGGLIGTQTIPFWPTLWVATLGAVLGDVLSFWLGRHYRTSIESFFQRVPKLHVWVQKAQHLLQRHGFKGIMIGRFAGPIRAFVPGLAGMTPMPWRWFLLADVTAAFLWCASHFAPGAMLGAVSQSIAPQATSRFLVSTLIFPLVAVISVAFIQGIGKIVRDAAHRGLLRLSANLKDHPALARCSHWLAPTDVPESLEQQLVILMTATICGLMAAVLTVVIRFHGPHFGFNLALFEFFRSLRNPIMDYVFVGISLLGDKYVFLIAGGLWAVVLAVLRQWRLLAIWLSLLIGCNGAVHIMKIFTHAPRPEGIMGTTEGFSFPSGHSSLFCSFATFWVLVFRNHARHFSLRLPEWIITLMVLVPLSRLYLGAHWLTDVWAGLCMGLFLAYVHVAYYLRNPVRLPDWKKAAGLLVVIYLGTELVYGHLHLEQMVSAHTPFYPTHITREAQWWSDSPLAPNYARKNRWGHPVESFNLEWAGSLDVIKTTLHANGWSDVAPEQIDDLVRHWFFKSHAEAFHVSDERHEGRTPVMIFYKNTPEQERLILKLWDNHVFLEDTNLPVWYGTIQSDRWNAETLLNSPEFEFRWIELPNTYGKHSPKIHHKYLLKIRPRRDDVNASIS